MGSSDVAFSSDKALAASALIWISPLAKLSEWAIHFLIPETLDAGIKREQSTSEFFSNKRGRIASVFPLAMITLITRLPLQRQPRSGKLLKMEYSMKIFTILFLYW
jgi:hypothetical protein